MAATLSALLPLMIGAAIVPVWGIIILLILASEGGRVRALAFMAGSILVRLLQGLLFGIVLNDSGSNTGGESSPIASTLLLVVGILLFITGIRKWLKEEDPDAPPPKWMETLNQMSVGTAFVSGALLAVVAVKQWVFTLSAISVITASPITPAESVIVYLIYIFVASLIMLVPISISFASPERSASVLLSARHWLDRNSRVIMIVVSLVFGTFFVYKGLSGLLAGG
jgi:threonine/homoserine/homoserine lactone efflux protein